MATTREQFITLRKSGMTPVQAKEEVMKTIAPITPSNTTNANIDQLAANRARVQSQIASGERPAVGTSVTPQGGQTQAPTPPPVALAPVTSSTTPSGATMNADGTVTPAPVTPTTPITTTPPVEVKPTEPVKPVTPVKTEPTVDYTQAQGREQEIMKNLEKFKTQGMTPDQIKGASGYESATPEKKAIIEGFLNPVKQDAGTIFSTLRAGGSVPMSDTPEYRQAQARYNTFKRFSTYDVASLSTAMQQGDLLMGTQAYNDVISDPNMLAKIQKARIFMNGEVNMVKIGEKQGQYVMTQNPTVAKALEDGYITAEEYNQMTSTPEVEAQAKVVSEAKTKYDEYKRQLEQISDDVDKEYEGKETTDSFRSAIKANRDKAVRRLYNSASDDLQNASGLYTELKNSSTQRLELNMKQYEQKQADARQIAQEQRQMQAQKDLIQYKSDFEKKQAQEALNDPQTQIQSTLDEFSKLGVTANESVASKVAKANEFINSGKGTLSDYVNTLRSDLMAKPEYKQSLLKKANEGVSFQTIGDKVYKVQNGQLVDTGISATKAPEAKAPEWKQDASGNWYNANSATSPEIQAGTLSPTSIAQYSTRLQGNNVQCGMVTNDYSKVKFPDAPRMGDSYESKIATINAIGKAPIPQVGGLFVMDTGTSTGHTGIVTAINGDGTFTATDANKSGSKDGGPLQTSTYKISDKVSFSNAPTGTATTTGTVDVPAYQKYLNSGTLPTGLKAGTAKTNEWLQGYSQWKSTANPLSDSVQKRVDSYSDDYSKNPNVQSAFKFAPLLRQYDTVKVSDLSSSQRQGIISDYAKALDPDSVVREGEYATVAKYSSSFGEKTLSEINQFLSGNGTLSDAAAQKVIDAIKSRGKNYVEQEKNVRNQYIEKINRATGYKDGDMQLVYPDYSTQSTNPQKSDFLNSLKSIATEFTKGLTSIK